MLALSTDSTPHQTPQRPIALTRSGRRRARLLVVRLLLTNDDGIESEGLHVLAAAMADAGHDVVIAAPDSDTAAFTVGEKPGLPLDPWSSLP